jgi:hypothetical protein
MEHNGLVHFLKEVMWLTGLLGAAASAASTAAIIYLKAFPAP